LKKKLLAISESIEIYFTVSCQYLWYCFLNQFWNNCSISTRCYNIQKPVAFTKIIWLLPNLTAICRMKQVYNFQNICSYLINVGNYSCWPIFFFSVNHRF